MLLYSNIMTLYVLNPTLVILSLSCIIIIIIKTNHTVDFFANSTILLHSRTASQLTELTAAMEKHTNTLIKL